MDDRFEALLAECIDAIGEEYIDVPEEMQIPHRFSRNSRRKMRKLMRQRSGSFSLLKFPRQRRLSMAITLTILIWLSLATAVICGSRYMLSGFFAEVFAVNTQIWNTPDEKPSEQITDIYMPTWLPEGYELVETYDFQYYNSYVYCNNPDCDHKLAEEHPCFKQYVKGKYITNYDNENNDMLQITIAEHPGIEIDFDDSYFLVWSEESYTFVFCSPNEFDENDALRIANSVQKVE